MTFQSYCNGIGDDQRVTAAETFLLTFTNTRDEVFTISPDSIKGFLSFLYENYENVSDQWSSIPSRKRILTQYEEKSYREIYRTANAVDDLKIITSTGRSQTKALTKLISKIISYLCGEQYNSPEENTFFSPSYIELSLSNWNKLTDESNANKESKKSIKNKSAKEMFVDWLVFNEGLSAKSASSYAGSIDFCDRQLSSVVKGKKSLYDMSSAEVLDAIEVLKNISTWSDTNKAGNYMYSSACKKLSQFLSLKSLKAKNISKPFILLAGISGTGKTRFVREQAKATGSIEETYCLTSVRPDWHEPSDLLGYISRLGEQPQYIATDVLRFIVKAWKEIIEEIIFENGEPADWRGRKLAEIRPFWLCLDEMNLAPVEQYFSDYLSILETREWKEPEPESKLDYYYDCDPLIKGELFSSLDSGHKQGFEKPSNLLAKDLGLDLTADPDKDIWAYFLKYGIAIPFNLIVAGTVNMDETTHGFSRKVIDRALSFDFGEFFPNDYNEFFLPQTSHIALSYPIWSQASQSDLADTIDPDGTKTVAFLTAVNKVLKNTPFELAYRALNELLLAVVSAQPQDDLTLKAVWDDFMMCKVLPRIEGDSDKLTTANGKALLDELNAVLAEQLMPIWQAEENAANQRPDLYREKIAGTTDEEKVLPIPCRSKSKLKWMSDRLASATFTSFWP